MDVVVGKPTAELHTSMDREVQTSIRKKDHEKELGREKDSKINKNNL